MPSRGLDEDDFERQSGVGDGEITYVLRQEPGQPDASAPAPPPADTHSSIGNGKGSTPARASGVNGAAVAKGDGLHSRKSTGQPTLDGVAPGQGPKSEKVLALLPLTAQVALVSALGCPGTARMQGRQIWHPAS